MNPPQAPNVKRLVEKLHEDLADLSKQALSEKVPPRLRTSISKKIETAARDLNNLIESLDPVRQPESVFDPGNPRTIGFFVSLALCAQSKQTLSGIQEFYGAGGYALYYKGDFPPYAPLKDSETPIYIGKSIPSYENARLPKEQGQSLYVRLNHHRKNIERATKTLSIDDFEYRALVVQSGWEAGAEDYLIRIFRPVWNKETKLIYGFGKHGDSAKTRGNKRSPWDTLHEGREWAGDSILKDAKSINQIEQELASHFSSNPDYLSINDLVTRFPKSLSQF